MRVAAKNASRIDKKRVALLSWEMNNEQLVQRLIAQLTAIDAQRLWLGEIRCEECPLVNQVVSTLPSTSIYLDDTRAITPPKLRFKCRLHLDADPDSVIVDNLP